MAIKTLRVFAEYTSTGFVPMPTAGGIDYGYTLANTFPSTTPSSFQTDDPDLDVTVTAMTDFYVWIRINGTAWNPSYTRNVRVYPDSPDINNVVMNMIIATGPAGTSAYSQIVQTSNRLYFNGATTDSVYNSKFAGKTYINELNFGTAPGLATVATSGAYADLTGKPALSTVATSGSYADLSNKPSGTAPISYNSGTNSFQISVASASTNGYLTSTDWSTFNAKYLLPSGGTTAQYLRGDGTLATFPTTLDSTRLIFTGRNSTGSTLTKGTVVYINGVSGNTALLAKAIASGDSTSAQTLGVIENDIANNATGTVVLVGAVGNLDTSSFTEGVQLYLSGTVAGAFTSSKVLAPTHIVYVGIVTRAHPTLGTIEVKIQNGYELDEIHDVQISSPANKDILYRDSATSLWKHASIASVLGYTPYNASNPSNYIALTALSASAPLSYNNTTGAFTISQANTTTNGFLSSTDWNTFNSKQSALTLGNVSEVSSNVLMFPDGGTGKTIGNLTIQVVQASASTNGYLSSTDWTTFNNKQATLAAASASVNGYLTSTDWSTFNSKQGAITLTTTGTSGAATFSANTLNIPQYQSALSGTGFVKISGSTISYDNSTYLTTTSASSTYLPLAGGTLTGALSGTSISLLSTITATKATFTGGGEIIRMYGSNPYLSWWDTANTSRYGYIQASSGLMNFVTDSGVALNFSVAGSDRMRIGSDGTKYLGVPTGSRLQIDAPGEAIYSYTNNFYIYGIYNDSNSLAIESAFGGNIIFRAQARGTSSAPYGAAERMRITSGGNVGIGASTNPTYLLEVSTAGGSQRIRVGTLQNNNNSATFEAITTANNTTASAAFFRANAGGSATIGVTTYNKTFGDSGNFANLSNQLNTVAIQITPGANILLATETDNGERLYVNGSIRATGNITANSDLTLKKNLTLIQNPIDKLISLNGYLYQWKENHEYQYGVIAQEVEKVLPYAVQTGNNKIKGVAYNQLTPLLIEGFKVHETELQTLKKRVAYLENKLG